MKNKKTPLQAGQGWVSEVPCARSPPHRWESRSADCSVCASLAAAAHAAAGWSPGCASAPAALTRACSAGPAQRRSCPGSPPAPSSGLPVPGDVPSVRVSPCHFNNPVSAILTLVSALLQITNMKRWHLNLEKQNYHATERARFVSVLGGFFLLSNWDILSLWTNNA